jgi:hypothetical protein
MPRKDKVVIISDDGGRDAGKHFYIKEMPAWQAFEWIAKVLCAVKRADPDIDIDITSGIHAIFGLNGPVVQSLFKNDFYTIKPIFDELMGCVKFVADTSRPMESRRAPELDDIEEVKTHIHLRWEVLRLHGGF